MTLVSYSYNKVSGTVFFPCTCMSFRCVSFISYFRYYIILLVYFRSSLDVISSNLLENVLLSIYDKIRKNATIDAYRERNTVIHMENRKW